MSIKISVYNGYGPVLPHETCDREASSYERLTTKSKCHLPSLAKLMDLADPYILRAVRAFISGDESFGIGPPRSKAK